MLAKTPLHEVVDRTALEPWRKALLDAADLIATRGLAKWTQEDDEGRLCAAGAICVAISGSTHVTNELYLKAAKELCALVDPERGGPARWNNRPERTADEVISAMRSCALQGVEELV